MKKTMLLGIILTLFAGVLQAQTAVPPASGIGSIGNPYQIATLDNLYWITQNETEWNKHYIQTADIDAASTSEWGNFTTIGNTVTTKFTGSYDGQGYIIDALYIRTLGNHFPNLFGATNGAELSNIGLTNIDAWGLDGAAGLAGWVYLSTIDNCYVTGSVQGSSEVGGLVGECSNSDISNSYADVSVGGSYRVGGLVGLSTHDSNITNSYATGSVNSNQSSGGGLVGGNESSTINYCYATGAVTGPHRIGGLVGLNGVFFNNVSGPYSTISNCYATGSVQGNDQTGGLVGHNFIHCTISKSYSIGQVSGSQNRGGLVGTDFNGYVTNCFWDVETSTITTGIGASSNSGTGKTTAEMKNVATFTDRSTEGLSTAWDFVGNPYDDHIFGNTWNIYTTYNSGYPF